MKLTIIERLHTEYLACWTVYDAAHGEAKEITAAAAARSESVRRLARLEIEKLGAQ